MAPAIRSLAAAAIGVGIVLTGLPAQAAPVTRAAAAPSGEVVIPAASRFVPRATRILNAGLTGFLWAQEGDDRLLWTDYATGTATALAQRLPEKVVYDMDGGFYPSSPSWNPGWYGAGSDTVALYDAQRVRLQTGAGGDVTEVVLPEGHSYQGTFGAVVLSRSGYEGGPQTYHLWRDGAESAVTGLPADAADFTVEDGDARSVILKYKLPDATGWGSWSIVDLATGVATALPVNDEDGWDVAAFRLGGDSVLRDRWGRGKMDVYDRDELTAAPRTVDTGQFGYQTVYGVAGSSLLAVDPIMPGNNIYRGQPLWSLRTDEADPDQTEVMSPAAHQIVQAPDGSVLVAGAAKYVQYGDLDWGFYRITEAAGGTIQRREIADIAPMPAQTLGMSLGSGILTTGVNSTIYEPGGLLGAYRSTWLTTGGTPSVEKTTLDAWVTGDDGDCHYSGSPTCVTMFADGTGFHGRRDDTYFEETMLYANGSATPGPKVKTGFSSPYLLDLSGRYGVINSGPKGAQAIADFRAGTLLQKRDDVPAAVWGNLLWSASAEGGRVTATRIPATTAVESFTTSNNCTPTQVQAVGRWVYWSCNEYGTAYGSGVYDRVTKTSAAAPGEKVLLGDGYYVQQDAAGTLTLFDLYHPGTAGRVIGAVGQYTEPRVSWTVDRFGGGVAWSDQEERVHVTPSGVPASALTVIDSAVSATVPNWSGTWWLSKPGAAWQLVFRSSAGTVLRTISGTSARGVVKATWDGKDSAGRAVANGTYGWSLTVTPADGQGAPLTAGVAAPPAPLKATKAPTITGAAVVGSTVKAATLGTWTPAPTSYTYRWAANGVTIKGAVYQSYPITAAVLGKRLTVTVTANRAGHPSGSSTSAATAVVAKGAAPRSTKRPVILGTPKVGRTLSVSTGGWSIKPDSYRYEWRLNGKLISTGTKLKLTSGMRNKKLVLTVVARKTGYNDGRAASVAVTVKS
ncbi:FlgD immunoglobulin-like domain containing protein [Paractinoplanes atraurantiacus]|uniref:FlgD Ig-like domain-containing protein n=1 Tax=Paractinoplanes atraurantiacus TaxID=1036182 RepID=A0A285JSU7_9ACTN|nr:FlgD immunoglobulin-like domain containing protein [Actinoplanes atraurantiacus]SNY63338.1 FlgD Ig-like domain-containing protein [Actinoplanes atraurantiacus]